MILPFLAQETASSGSLVDTIQAMGVDGPRFFSQVVLFIALALCLRKFAYGPILNILEERRATIATGLENAAKSKQELVSAEAQRQEIIREATVKANKIVQDAHKAADEALQRRLQEATREAEQLIRSARQATEQERIRVMAELRKEVVRLVISTTGKTAGKILTAEDQERLKSETLAVVSLN